MPDARKVTFSVLGGGQSRTGLVRNGDARLGDVAPRVARSLGLVGGFECLSSPQGNEVLSPETRLKDLPVDEVFLVSEHTPASSQFGV